MKKYILFSLLLLSCGVKHQQHKFEYGRSNNSWIDAFKDQMFFECLKQSYSNDSILILIQQTDLLNPYDGLDIENINYAKALGDSLVSYIPPPAMCEVCKDQENYYMATCLHYYKSQELDSIATSEYNKFKKRQEELYKK